MSSVGKSALLICALLCSDALLAQDDSSCLRRPVVVTVVMGQPPRGVVGLTGSNFRAHFRGKPIRILSVERDSRPRRAVIVLDTSSGMVAPPGKLSSGQRVALELISSAPANSRLALLTFGGKITEQAGFDQSPGEIAETVKGLGDKGRPSGKRAGLYDAILEALRLLSPPSGGDVIYVVATTHGESGSRTSEGDARRALTLSQTRIYSILLLELNPPTPEAIFMPEKMTQLSEATGGSMFVHYVDSGPRTTTGSPKEEQQEDVALARAATSQAGASYILELELPQAPEKKERWKLEVVGFPEFNGRVLYAHDLLPCSDATPKK